MEFDDMEIQEGENSECSDEDGETDEDEMDDESSGEEDEMDDESSGEEDEMEDLEDGLDVSSKLGQTFGSVKEARDVVNLYGIEGGYRLRFVKNESSRLRVVCLNSKSCPFLFYCSKIGNDGGMAVKTLILEHSCYKQWTVPSMTQTWLANHFKSRVYKDTKFTAKQMQEDIKINFKLHVSLFKCKRARKLIMTELNGSVINEFKMLEAYIQILKEKNPGSRCELQLSKEAAERGARVFRRLFVMLDACKRNWLIGCRPIICLDGCHLKSLSGGVLLTAVGKDANDQIMPLAWAVVSKENKVNWTWFMSLMKAELELKDGESVTIISDMQKGLINVVELILPQAEHRWCARHIYANWSKNWRGPELKKRFWICAWSSYEEEFKENLTKLGEIKKKAADELMSLLEARSKPIVSMLEDIRVLVMNRFRDRKRMSMTWKREWSPAAMKVFMAAREDSTICQVLWNGDNGYEIGEGLEKHTVLLDRMQCTCRIWGLRGIPCQHAIAAMYHSKMNPESKIAHWYHKDTYENSYVHTIQPVPGVKFYKIKAHAPIEPPAVEKKIGRPKKVRVRASNESRQKAHKLSRIGQPGMPSARVVSLGDVSTQESSDPGVRFPIPDERECKRKYKDIGKNKSTKLPFKPPGLRWKGKNSVTAAALVDEAVAKRTRLSKAKSSQSSGISNVYD
ncbi:uncharacterized protein LOC131023057 [Salvia miltiorrhiza]|uniref:uncharacterized protein LOC131023057 n=1 Tax=Salvia miltiorrhiza TaxID=226208 RepID=UPI0025ABE037|nr:uncharacterized protein LOC131023057 [Salvia miltiorrhiza]